MKVGLYSWRSPDTRRKSAWHIYEGKPTTRSMVCGVAIPAGLAARDLVTQIVEFERIEVEAVAFDRVCKGCLIHTAIEVLKVKTAAAEEARERYEARERARRAFEEGGHGFGCA